MRLWVQRHALPARQKVPVGGRSYGATAAIVAVVVVAASGAAFATAKVVARPATGVSGAADRATRTPDLRQSARALAAAAASREQAAAWVATQVSHGVIVGCDPLMCAALLAARLPAS